MQAKASQNETDDVTPAEEDGTLEGVSKLQKDPQVDEDNQVEEDSKHEQERKQTPKEEVELNIG